MSKVKLRKLKCQRCGKEWTPRQEDVRQCPKCKSARWDVKCDLKLA
jgi:Zn finger protein HypA/HybF involved in hydrogenase expression